MIVTRCLGDSLQGLVKAIQSTNKSIGLDIETYVLDPKLKRILNQATLLEDTLDRCKEKCQEETEIKRTYFHNKDPRHKQQTAIVKELEEAQAKARAEHRAFAKKMKAHKINDEVKRVQLRNWADKGAVRLIQLLVEDDIYLIDTTKYEHKEIQIVLEALSPKPLVIQNAQFEYKWLLEKYDFIHEGRVFDTYIMSAILGCGEHRLHGLQVSLDRHLDVLVAKSTDHRWDKEIISEENWKYAEDDVRYLRRLASVLWRKLGEEKLRHIYKLEEDLLYSSVEVERYGIPTNKAAIEKLIANQRAEFEKYQQKIRDYIGVPDLQIRSPKTKEIYSQFTGVRFEQLERRYLQALLVDYKDNERLHKLVAYHAAAKLADRKANLSSSLVAFVHDNRLLGEYRSMGTCTGRFSGKNPNVQNLDRKIRGQLIVTQPGTTILAADFAQVEFKVLAHLTQDPCLLQCYAKDGESTDLHGQLVNHLFPGERAQDVECRYIAKRINFGICYGMGARELAFQIQALGIDMTTERARELLDKYKQKYTGVAKLFEDLRAECSKGDVTKYSLLGRRRLCCRYTEALNMPIQSTAADIQKRAISLVHNDLPPSARLVWHTHDEIAVEIFGEDDIELVTQILKDRMSQAFREQIPNLQDAIDVETITPYTWS